MMKKVLTLLVAVFCSCFVMLQADEVKVTMKNGSIITGELKELVATDHVTLIVAGIETVISMDEVSSLEKITDLQIPRPQIKQFGSYEVLEKKQYPESFNIKIGEQVITMILVKGGWFNMGYDGRHSISYDSEPVHRVILSSYYVSKQLLNKNAVETLLKKKKISKNTQPYSFTHKEDADLAIKELVKMTETPYRLITEAEWEYAAIMPFSKMIFGASNSDYKNEWCSDRWAMYSPDDQINPKIINSGKEHVIRHYSTDNEKWRREKAYSSSAYVRIAISADDVKF